MTATGSKIIITLKYFSTKGRASSQALLWSIFMTAMEEEKNKGLWIPEEVRTTQTSSDEKILLSKLYNLYEHYKKPVYCYIKHFANEWGMSESTVKRMLSKLEEKGLIKKTKENYGEGKRNLYEVTLRETPTVATIEPSTASRVEETPAKEETATSTPSWMEKEIDRLLMPAVSYNYHELKDKEFKTVIKYLSPMKNVGYFRQKCKSMRDNPILLTPQWAGLAKNHIEAHPNDFISPFLEYTIEQSDDRIKAAAIR